MDPFSYIIVLTSIILGLGVTRSFSRSISSTRRSKGLDHFRAQGPVYAVTMLMWFLLCVVAAFTKSRRFHACFAVIFLIYNLAFAGMQLITAQDAPGAGLLRSR